MHAGGWKVALLNWQMVEHKENAFVQFTFFQYKWK